MPALPVTNRFGTTVASATTIVAPIDGDFFPVSGSIAIVTIQTAPVGAPPRAIGSIFRIRFTGTPLLTHNATTLILADGASYTPQAGEVLTFEVIGTNQVREHGARNRTYYTPQRTITTTDTFTLADSEIIATGGSYTETALAAASSNKGREFELHKPFTDTAANVYTIAGTIDGSTTRNLKVPGSRIRWRSDGALLKIINFEVPGAYPIAWAATITPDASWLPRNDRDGTFSTTLAGATTLAAPLNPIDGQVIRFAWTQDATGSRVVTYNAVFGFSTTFPSPTLSTTAGKIDYVTFKYNLAAAKWHCVGVLIGN